MEDGEKEGDERELLGGSHCYCLMNLVFLFTFLLFKIPRQFKKSEEDTTKLVVAKARTSREDSFRLW